MLRKLVILAAVAAAFPAAALAGGPETLMPGVTYEDGVQFTPHGAVVLHVIRAPRPGGLYRVEPTLAQGTILGRETVTGMQERLAGSATIASVNGDLFDARDGHPSGIVLRGGVLDHPPFTGRSSAGFDAQGLLHVDRVRFFGTWKGAGQRRPLAGVDQVPAPGEVVLFTPAWGARTPPLADAVDVVLPSFPPARPDSDLTGTVAQVVRGGGTPIPAGGAVLQARGNLIGQKVLAEVRPGATITARLILQPDWAGIQDAIGGGPLLVRDGKAVFRANEAFAAAQLQPRAPRAAVGQAADGSVLLVTVDGGRAGGSVGMTSFELALALQRLGAVRAMALGSGAQTTMAFDGTLLNRPAGAEQPVGDALSIVYTGVYAPPPQTDVFSPNGDGIGDAQTLSYALVRPSTVKASLVGPDGVERIVDQGQREPGVQTFPFTGADASGAPLPEGTWRWVVQATDDTGAASTAERDFGFDRTLGFVRAAGAGVTAQLTRPAALRLEIATTGGVPVATVDGGRQDAGTAAVGWDGTLAGGGRAHPGRYLATLVATSDVGTSSLTVVVRL